MMLMRCVTRLEGACASVTQKGRVVFTSLAVANSSCTVLQAVVGVIDWSHMYLMDSCRPAVGRASFVLHDILLRYSMRVSLLVAFLPKRREGYVT